MFGEPQAKRCGRLVSVVVGLGRRGGRNHKRRENAAPKLLEEVASDREEGVALSVVLALGLLQEARSWSRSGYHRGSYTNPYHQTYQLNPV